MKILKKQEISKYSGKKSPVQNMEEDQYSSLKKRNKNGLL